jgi:hypothetical protein
MVTKASLDDAMIDDFFGSRRMFPELPEECRLVPKIPLH